MHLLHVQFTIHTHAYIFIYFMLYVFMYVPGFLSAPIWPFRNISRKKRITKELRACVTDTNHSIWLSVNIPLLTAQPFLAVSWMDKNVVQPILRGVVSTIPAIGRALVHDTMSSIRAMSWFVIALLATILVATDTHAEGEDRQYCIIGTGPGGKLQAYIWVMYARSYVHLRFCMMQGYRWAIFFSPRGETTSFLRRTQQLVGKLFEFVACLSTAHLWPSTVYVVLSWLACLRLLLPPLSQTQNTHLHQQTIHRLVHTFWCCPKSCSAECTVCRPLLLLLIRFH